MIVQYLIFAFGFFLGPLIVAIPTLLVQAFVAGEYEGRSKALWSDFRRYLCRLLGGA